MKKYEEIPHTSDIAMRVYGKDLKDLLQNAAYGMFDIMADLEGIKNSISVNVNVSGASKEELLVSWLDDLLYNFYTKGIIFSQFSIDYLDNEKLAGRASGRLVGDNRNRLKREIKAATFHDLNIKETRDGLSVDVVFDV